VHATEGFASLQDSKTGPRRLYLSDDACALLQLLPNTGEWVFPGRRTGSHLTTMQRAWHRLRQSAGISDRVRIHDLRHSFASLGAQSGVNLLFIKELLGHTKFATTERYTHAGTDPVKHAASTIGTLVGTALRAR
jgi:integrase